MEYTPTYELEQELLLAAAYFEQDLEPPQFIANAPQPQPARRRPGRVRGYQYRVRTAAVPVGQSEPAEHEQEAADDDLDHFAGDDGYQPGDSPEPDQTEQLAQQVAHLLAAYGLSYPPEPPELQSQHYTEAAAEHAAYAALRPFLLWCLVKHKQPPANDALCAICGCCLLAWTVVVQASHASCVATVTSRNTLTLISTNVETSHVVSSSPYLQSRGIMLLAPQKCKVGNGFSGSAWLLRSLQDFSNRASLLFAAEKHFNMTPTHCLGCHQQDVSWSSVPEQAKPIYCVHQGVLFLSLVFCFALKKLGTVASMLYIVSVPLS